MLERMLLALITQAGSALFTYVMSRRAKKTETAVEVADIEARLERVKNVTAGVLDGTPITKEQSAELRAALADFLRGGARNGGM